MNKFTTFLAISYLGAITNWMTDAKSLFGALAALASFIASLYAIAIAHRKFREARPSRVRRRASSPGGRSSRLKKFRKLITRCSLLLALIFLTACSSPTDGKSIAYRIANLPTTILDATASFVTTTTTNIVDLDSRERTSTLGNKMEAGFGSPQTIDLAFLSETNSALSTQHSALHLVTNITATPNSTLTKSIDTAEAISGFLPPPYGEITAGILALATAGLTAAVRRRNAMLKTVITGVEKSGVPNVKEAIANEANQTGIAPDLHALVKEVTQSK